MNERLKNLLQERLDYTAVECFPTPIREVLSGSDDSGVDGATSFLTKSSLICHKASTNPGSHWICEVVYSGAYLGLGPIDEWITFSHGGQALFHRLSAVSDWLIDKIAKEITTRNGDGVFIRDLGGGSAPYGIRTLSRLRSSGFDIGEIEWECIDCSESSITYGQEKAHRAQLAENISFRKENFMSRGSYRPDQADIAVLVGILCGMSIDEARRCLEKIKPHFRDELIAATLLDTSFNQSPHVYQVLGKLGWHLSPKTADEVVSLFHESGYDVLSVFGEHPNGGQSEYAIVHAKKRG